MPEETPQKSSNKELIDLLLRFAPSGVLVIYAAGFLIINLHLYRFGASGFGLLQSQYAAAGATWTMFILSGCFAAHLIEDGTAHFRNGKRHLGIFRGISGSALLLFVLYLTTNSIDHSWVLDLFSCVISLAGGWGALHMLRQIVRIPGLHSHRWLRRLIPSSQEGTRLPAFFYFVAVPFFLIVQIGLYSLFTFTVISSGYGGGAPRSVFLHARPQNKPIIEALGVKMENDTSTESLRLLAESEAGYLFDDNYGTGGRKSLFIKKDLVEAVTYFGPKYFRSQAD